LGEPRGDVTVNLSMERVVAYVVLLLTLGGFYAKMQGDLNYLRERSDKMEARFDRVEGQLYQLMVHEKAVELRDQQKHTAPGD
jgi:hypothetical protein